MTEEVEGVEVEELETGSRDEVKVAGTLPVAKLMLAQARLNRRISWWRRIIMAACASRTGLGFI